jgi:hypothetical protein
MPAPHVDIENPAGVRQGGGPFTDATNIRLTRRLSKAGTVAIDVPAADPKTALLVAKQIMRVRAMRGGVQADIGAGIIDSITARVHPPDPLMLTVAGDDILSELANRRVIGAGNVPLILNETGVSTGTNPATTAAALTAIMAHAPAGWTLDSTTYGSVGTTTNASTSVTGVTNIKNITENGPVIGTGIPAGATATAVNLITNAVTLSVPATASATVALSGSTAYHQFGTETVLAAFIWLATAVGEQFRLGTGRQVVWLYKQQPTSGLRAISQGDSTALATNTSVVLIDTLEEVADTHAAITRIYPYGAGNGTARVTLAGATWTPPTGYSIDTTNNYIAYTATDGVNRIDDIVTYNSISTIGTGSAHAISAANQLAQTTYEDLRRRVVATKTYRLTVTKIDADIAPGNTVWVRYRKVVDSYVATNINADLVVLENSTTFDAATGVANAQLTLATVDRWPTTGVASVVLGLSNGASASSSNVQVAQRALTSDTADLATTTAADTITARYTTIAAQSIANNTITNVNFDTLVDDPSSLVTTGAGWAFTAPATGRYHVSASVMFAATTTWALGTKNGQLYLYVDGVLICYLDYNDSREAGTSQFMLLHGSDTAYVVAGQTIQVRVRQSSGGALVLLNSALGNYIAVSLL